MAETKSERKVAVILVTDVVGYSSMMEENENQTLQNLKASRIIIKEFVKEHHGRIFNSDGDSVLAEFPCEVKPVTMDFFIDEEKITHEDVVFIQEKIIPKEYRDRFQEILYLK